MTNVTPWQEPHFVDHCCKWSCGVGTSGETKEADIVALKIWNKFKDDMEQNWVRVVVPTMLQYEFISIYWSLVYYNYLWKERATFNMRANTSCKHGVYCLPVSEHQHQS